MFCLVSSGVTLLVIAPLTRRWLPLGLIALVLLRATSTMAESPEERMAAAYHARGEFDGVVLVADGDKMRCLAAFGPSGPAPDAPPLAPQTVFPICSITKQFTAVLVLQLVDAGKLGLDSTLGEVLPDFRFDAPGRAITVRQLLTHSSGLPNLDAVRPEIDGVEGFYRLEGVDFAHPLSVLQKYVRGPLEFTPGGRFAYNNSDYWALGAIVEHLARQPYDTLLTERILRPLGMAHTGLCTPSRPLPPGSAQGRVRDPKTGAISAGKSVRLENFWAAGAMFSTAEDLLRWSVALDTGKLLSPAMRTAMFTPDPKLGFVALSTWAYRTAAPGRAEKILLLERQGEIDAFHTLSLCLPEQHGHILLLSNLDVADLNSTYMGKGLPAELVRAFLAP